MSRPWIDMLRDGAQRADLRDGYDLGISRVLGAAALGALNAGYSRARWEAEVLDPRSNLGHQVRLDRRGRVRTERSVSNLLGKAWERAETQATKSPRWTADEARRAAAGRAQVVRDLVANPDADLTDAHRIVLAYAADRAEATGSTRVNLPQRATGEALGMTPRQVRRVLDTLNDRHLLICRERGRPSGPSAKAPPKSSAYDLPDAEAAAAYLCRVPRQVRPPALTGAPPWGQPSAPPALTGTPSAQRDTTEETDDMNDITLTRDQIVAALGEAALSTLLAARRQHAEVRHLHAVGDEESVG